MERSESMEEQIETPTTKSDASQMSTPMAIRLVKASHLLSSLSPKHRAVDETAAMKREIRDLKAKVARERLKNKRLKLWSSFELLLQLAVLVSISSLTLILIFESL